METLGLIARQQFYCSNGFYYNGNRCVRRSGWYHFGRWILAGIIILIGVLFLLSCLFISRRQRRRGVRPMYGTGWLGGSAGKPDRRRPGDVEMSNQGGNGYSGPPPYGPYGYGGYQPQPPPADYNMTGTTFSPADGYYAGQQYGVQPPPNAYRTDQRSPK